MQEAERQDFRRMLAELFGALDKPLTEAKEQGFWTALNRMSLVEFGRCRDHLLRSLQDGEPRRSFSVSDVWAAKKALRAQAPDLPASTEQSDPWLEVANARLLKHFREHADRLKHYGRGPSFDSMKDRPGQSRLPNGDASAQYIANIQRMIAAKNAWVADMKDMDRGEGVLPELQQKIWEDYVLRAEREILSGEQSVAA